MAKSQLELKRELEKLDRALNDPVKRIEDEKPRKRPTTSDPPPWAPPLLLDDQD